MDRDPLSGPPRASAESGYALGRLWRAIETATTHPDGATRRRAEEKALAWEAVLDGMASGALDVGSRTPVAGTPAWVTLEVAHGGFATGSYVAEGPLGDDEQDLLAGLPPAADGSTDRLRLNTWFLSDEGLARITDALRSGNYAVDVPEHGALAVVAWLVQRGHDALALDLVAELYPLLDRLRFYPALTERSPSSSAVVHLRSVGDVAADLRAITAPRQLAAMNETLRVWLPLYDRLVALWLTTVEDGWPCRRWPDDWAEQRTAWLDDYNRAAGEHRLSGEHRKPRSTLAILRSALERCESDSAALTGRDVGRIRQALRRSVDRWGEPASPPRQALRSQQRAWATRPARHEFAAAVAGRLSAHPPDGGIADLGPILEPIPTGDGSVVAVPEGLAGKVERALEAPVEDLVERGLIPSSEVLAQVLPQISSHVAAGAFDDPELRELYSRIYAAFRRRRSLLLLNLERQVRIEEVPWVQALSPFRAPTSGSVTRAADTLRQTTLLAFSAFPHTVLPNPLVREMAALAQGAAIEIPFVEELAADIFMGTFTTKWLRAATIASTAMSGTLYARYYDLPDASVWTLSPGDADGDGDGEPDIHTDRAPFSERLERLLTRWGRRPRQPGPAIPGAHEPPGADPDAMARAARADFVRLCEERAREAHRGDGGQVARNGTVIEQSQILTTHNLAPLVDRLSLADRLAPQAGELATTTFHWIVQQHTIHTDRWSMLPMLKNTAYAWRQAIFFLSLADRHAQRAALDQLRIKAQAGTDDWQRRFEPVIAGLEASLGGATFDANGELPGGRRFLGWSVGPHWLIPPD